MASTELGSLTPTHRVVLAIANSGLTQKVIAERSGIPAATISELKKGKQRLRVEQAVKLAEATREYDLLLDFRGLVEAPEPDQASSGSAADNVTDLGERRSTWIHGSAGQRTRSVAA